MAFSAPWLPLRHGARQVEKACFGYWVPVFLFYPSSLQEAESGLRPLPSQGDKRGSLARTVPQGCQGGGPGLAPGPACPGAL